MAQPGIQPTGNQCQYILSCNANNTDDGNLQPGNEYATSLAYASNNFKYYYYTYQQFSMHQYLQDINNTHFFLYYINNITRV